jgi:hypothetical protein
MVTPYVSRIRPRGADPGTIRPRRRGRFEPPPAAPIDGPSAVRLSGEVAEGSVVDLEVSAQRDTEPPGAEISGPAPPATRRPREASVDVFAPPAPTSFDTSEPASASAMKDRPQPRAAQPMGRDERSIPGVRPPDTGAQTLRPPTSGRRPVAPDGAEPGPRHARSAELGRGGDPPADARSVLSRSALPATPGPGAPVRPSAALRVGDPRPTAASAGSSLGPVSLDRTAEVTAPPSPRAPEPPVSLDRRAEVTAPPSPLAPEPPRARGFADAPRISEPMWARYPAPPPGTPAHSRAADARTESAEVPTELTVTIGRVEVKVGATTTHAPPPTPRPRRSPPSLDDYLRARAKGLAG